MKLFKFNYLVLFTVCILSNGCTAYSDSDHNTINHNTIGHQHKKRILLLNSYSHGYTWSDNTVMGIRDTFKDDQNVVINIEYMDTKMIDTKEHFELLKQLYKNKYAQYTIDVIIASDHNALQFLRKYRDELFPDVPVVFCGINNFSQEKVEGFKNYTVINAKTDFIANFELILALHPDIKTLYVINDTVTTARSLQTEFFEALKEYEDKFTIKILADLSLQNLIDRVSSLEQDSVVYYLSFFKDSTGRSLAPAEVIPYISKASPVPVYGSTDYMLGHGIVGGSLKSGYFQGKTAAEAARKILQGVRAGDIPVVMDNPSVYMFDYLQLQRFDIHISDLPKDSIVINQPKP